jgi:ubiquinone/menaquinone biosynthesis C-methylase UbiE
LKGNNPKFLDIGCGDGNLTVKFAARTGAGERYGIDSHEPALIEARKRGVTVVQIAVASKVQIEQGKANDQ